ncbi:hypothetical protein GW17_00017174 [Ensete ventricosum]|nr:hypothetical protein GW17_00017174 [Ensete ventricosum]
MGEKAGKHRFRWRYRRASCNRRGGNENRDRARGTHRYICHDQRGGEGFILAHPQPDSREGDNRSCPHEVARGKGPASAHSRTLRRSVAVGARLLLRPRRTHRATCRFPLSMFPRSDVRKYLRRYAIGSVTEAGHVARKHPMADGSRFPRSITDADLPRGMDPFTSRGELLVLLPAVRLDDMVGQLPSPNHEVGGCRGY